MSVPSAGKEPAATRKGLFLRLFGGPVLTRDGGPVRLSPFQSGLLAITYGLPIGEIPRSTVQKHLWDHSDTKPVRHRLSQLIYQTNHRCGVAVVSLDGELVRTNPDVVPTDLQELDRLIDAENLKAAAKLIEPGFLSALPERFRGSCSEWIADRQADEQAKLETAAHASWKHAELSRNEAVAEEAVRTLLKLSPNQEEALRRAMHARALYGSVREAESIYRAFAERALGDDDWVPEPETRALLKALRNVYGGPASLMSVPYTRLGRKIPFLGRIDERAKLTKRLLQKSETSPWRSTTVTGAAGAGKTRFLEEVLEGLSSRQLRVIRTCPEELSANTPLSTLADGLKAPWVLPFLRELHNPWRSVMLSLLPQFSEDAHMPRQIPLPAGQASRYAGDAFLHLFHTMAKTEPIVLVVDDFHFIDDASAMVLQYLHRRWSHGYFNLVAAYRPEELSVRNRRLVRFTEELRRGPNAERIILDELSRADAKSLARAVSPTSLTDGWLERLTQLAGGNPLFVVELATEPSQLPAPDEWHARIPTFVKHMVRRHLGALDPTGRQVLFGLVVRRGPATAQDLASIAGVAPGQCIEALEGLAASGLVAWAGDSVRVRHGLVRHAVYQTLSPVRRALLHRSVADLLARRSDPVLLADASIHYYRAGDRAQAQRFAMRALERAPLDGIANRLGVLAAAYRVSDAETRAHIGARLAMALYRSRCLAAVLRVGNGILTSGHRLAPGNAIRLRLVMADARHLLGRDTTDAVLTELDSLAEEAEGVGDGSLAPMIRDTILRVLHRSADYGAMRNLLADIEAGPEGGDDVGRCRTEASLAMKVLCGDQAAGLVHARRAVAMATRHRLRDETMYALHRHAVALIASGRLASEEGQDLMSTVTTASEPLEDPGSYALLLLDLTDWHTNTGILEPAARTLEKARAVAERMDCHLVECRYRMTQAALALAQGDPQAARTALDAVRGGSEPVPGGDAPDNGTDGGTADGTDGGTDDGGVTDHTKAVVPPDLRARFASLEGNCFLELGKLGRAARVGERFPPDAAPPGTPGGAPVDLILFHARLRSRTGDGDGAMKTLEDGAMAVRDTDPVAWLRLSLERVRLGRRTGTPLPDLATEARKRALSLDLPGLAHEFVPFQE